MEAASVHSFTHFLPSLACIFSVLRDERRSYDGYQIMRISNLSNYQTGYRILQEIYESEVFFEFLTRPRSSGPTDVMLCPEQVEGVQRFLSAFQIPYTILVPNVQNVIEVEQRKNEMASRGGSDGMNWKTYHRLATIQRWMERMASEYPALVNVSSYGKSYEGREMKVMKISTGGGGSDKPSVWIDGGIHAREWISPATVTYIANELIQTALKASEKDYRFVDSVDWYIAPNLNPDGYEYSHTTDRMWRKTRSKDGSLGSTILGCVGTDPNRNWAYKWGGKGTSGNPCSSIYRGKKAGSEPEVASTQAYIYERKDAFKLFLTFHSYSQMIFVPWGYDAVDLEDKEDLMVVARKAAKALQQTHGTAYQTGASPELLYPAAGGSEDWARGVAGIKFSYCIELRDEGKHGFTLPSEQIIPTGEETWAAVRAMVEGVMGYYEVEGF